MCSIHIIYVLTCITYNIYYNTIHSHYFSPLRLRSSNISFEWFPISHAINAHYIHVRYIVYWDCSPSTLLCLGCRELEPVKTVWSRGYGFTSHEPRILYVSQNNLPNVASIHRLIPQTFLSSLAGAAVAFILNLYSIHHIYCTNYTKCAHAHMNCTAKRTQPFAMHAAPNSMCTGRGLFFLYVWALIVVSSATLAPRPHPPIILLF